MLALKTYKNPWINIGTIAYATADDDVALGVSERTLAIAGALTNSVYKEVPTSINALEVRFLGTTNGKDAQYTDVWAGRLGGRSNCDLCRVCTLVPEIGTQVQLGTGLLYADNITITNNNWLKTIYKIQSGVDTDQMTRLIFDLCGYDLILFHGHSGGYTEDLQIEISGF